jgi:hypothetical protein
MIGILFRFVFQYQYHPGTGREYRSNGSAVSYVISIDRL